MIERRSRTRIKVRLLGNEKEKLRFGQIVCIDRMDYVGDPRGSVEASQNVETKLTEEGERDRRVHFRRVRDEITKETIINAALSDESIYNVTLRDR